MRSETPRVDRAEVDRVVDQARAMISREVVLSTVDETRRLSVTPAQLGTILRVSVDGTEQARARV